MNLFPTQPIQVNNKHKLKRTTSYKHNLTGKKPTIVFISLFLKQLKLFTYTHTQWTTNLYDGRSSVIEFVITRSSFTSIHCYTTNSWDGNFNAYSNVPAFLHSHWWASAAVVLIELNWIGFYLHEKQKLNCTFHQHQKNRTLHKMLNPINLAIWIAPAIWQIDYIKNVPNFNFKFLTLSLLVEHKQWNFAVNSSLILCAVFGVYTIYVNNCGALAFVEVWMKTNNRMKLIYFPRK